MTVTHDCICDSHTRLHVCAWTCAPVLTPPPAELQSKLGLAQEKRFYLFKVLRAHILPLTNVAFNKAGSRWGRRGGGRGGAEGCEVAGCDAGREGEVVACWEGGIEGGRGGGLLGGRER